MVVTIIFLHRNLAVIFAWVYCHYLISLCGIIVTINFIFIHRNYKLHYLMLGLLLIQIYFFVNRNYELLYFMLDYGHYKFFVWLRLLLIVLFDRGI